MYSYLYDSCLSENKYATNLARVEARLTQLGINGKINRLSFLKNIRSILTDELKRGLKNLIIVGNDQTVNQVLNLAADLDVTFGFIPLGQPQTLAKILGLPDPLAACDILAGRKIEKIDVGLVNDYYFLTSIILPGEPLILECDQSYFLTLTSNKTEVKICNLDFINGEFAKPQDGFFEIVIKEKPSSLSFFRTKQIPLSKFLVRKINLSAKKSTVIRIDQQKTLKTPVTIKIEKQKIPFIVGKDRLF
ncbi:MAG: diacylglycerol kinase family protein [Candidatus Buchananbacteria bacterium]